MPSPHFRAGVVTVVRDVDGKILAFERADIAGQWQLPQGGIEPGETPKQAAWRELSEETGLTKQHVRLVDEFADWTVYLWPKKMQRRERIGQAHRWFFFEPRVSSLCPVPDGKEFSNWRWMQPADLIEQVVDFRRAPYRQVLGG
jgi:putative (di)nucleoside polyphosphate hydrolase